ncbi:phosphate signaling complex protein PhoU [Amycolatopsis sp. EV170708-02-1]|uniref:phosphate signaling complex protein PhoU n=1 Tax=Amycolatopsis sp. EV170708-02-1 TaxID=2919322 RepID=UPI001F0C44E7|nr:phosphate signaling complex protein PhoU [Amycolatopsis sp. EV170708-02-1]UMP06777.1 phosphate signaling complex protein PhoU [Amycolatopsis sp. EV170708-02-1]
MRESFHGELTKLGEQLTHMCRLAAESMRQASKALLTADLTLAERVLDADADLDQARADCETQAQALLALQAPVAGDLRTILAAVYCAEKIERMGDLAAHVADTARFTHPAHAVPAELEPLFTDMSTIAAGMADRLAERITSEAAGGFAELDETDQAVDTLHARVLGLITGRQWQHGVQPATSLALLARFYERFADQAVSVAKRLEFAETGELPPKPGA